MQAEIADRELTGLDRDIVDLLSGNADGLTRAVLCGRLQPSPSHSTLSRRLSALVKSGSVRKTGTGKDALYAAGPDDRTALPPQLRGEIAFDPTRLDGYVPGEGRWLPVAYRDRMAAAAGRLVHEHDVTTYCTLIADRFLVDLCWASTNLKGDRIDYLAAESLVKYGQIPAGKRPVDETLVLNHKQAFLAMLAGVGSRVDAACVSRVHAAMMADMLPDARRGLLRVDPLHLASTSYVPPSGADIVADYLDVVVANAGKAEDPFEAAFLLLAGISYLQPFTDGSERTARVICNIPLLARGLPPLSFIGIDLAGYHAGLVEFYETGSVSTLAEAVVSAYEAGASAYAALAGAVPPPSELVMRETARIADEIWAAVMGNSGPEAVTEALGIRFEGLPEEELAEIVEFVLATLASIDATNCEKWGVDPAYAVAYRDAVKSA